MKPSLVAVILTALLAGNLRALEPSTVALPSPPAAQGTFAGSVSICALTSKWIVAAGAFTDPVTSTLKPACFVYDAVSLRFLRRIAPGGQVSSLAVEGDTLVVGDISDNGNRGAAFVFNLLNGALIQKLTNPDALTGDVLGSTVAISGRRVLASAPGNDALASGAGEVLLFDLSLSTTPVKLRASDGQAGDFFGNDLEVSGDLAVIGASGDDDRGSNAGSAYVFDLGIQGKLIPAPAQVGKLRASDGAANKSFGRAVAVSGNTIAIGSAPSSTGGFSVASAVYLFDTVTLTQLRRIGGAFTIGRSLAMDDGLALTGQAEGALSGGDVFLIDTTSGQIVRTFGTFEGLTTDFGLDVKLAGGTALISDGDSLITVVRGLTRSLPVSTLAKIGDTMPRTGGRTLKTVEAYQVMESFGATPLVMLLGQLSGLKGRTGLWGGTGPGIAAITQENPLGGAITSKISQAVCRDPISIMYLAQHSGPGITSLNDTSVVVHAINVSVGLPGLPTSLYTEGQEVSLSAMNGRHIHSFGQLVASGGLAFTTTIRSIGGPGSTVVTAANDSGAFVSSATSAVPLAAVLEGAPSPIVDPGIGAVLFGSDRATHWHELHHHRSRPGRSLWRYCKERRPFQVTQYAAREEGPNRAGCHASDGHFPHIPG